MRSLVLLMLLLPAVGLAEPLRVYASVLPIKTFVEKVGGAYVDARAMVRPGYNPQTYDPTPQQISALAGAVLYVRTGVPFEDAWMARIRSANPDMEVIDARVGLAPRVMEAHAHDGEELGETQGRAVRETTDDQRPNERDHRQGAYDAPAHEIDPHVWTSPPLVKHMVGAIRDKLAELDPDHAADFQRNHDIFVVELDALDRELRALLDPLPHRKFLVFHPAWGYFADTYSLVQVPIQREGKEPGARTLAALIEQAKREGIRIVFVQPQFDRRQARQLAQEIAGTVIAVDPLAPDYTDNLRSVARQIAQALQP